jgi:GT2 family glycosyltransferase
MPRLSIVIVTFDSAAEIDACLDSIARHPPAVDHDIVVVDNASSDGTAAAVRLRWPGIRVIDAAANLGFARANNLGIRQSAGSLILLLNPDTRVTPGALDALIHALDGRPDAAAAGPRLVDAAGRAELSFGRMIGPLAELRQKLLVRGHRYGVPLVHGMVERLTRRPRHVDWVSGACLLVRRDDAEAVGLFDERYFMYGEDVDFCAALRARGRTILFTPAARIVHLRGRSAAAAPAATMAAARRSQLAFYEKHHPRWVPLLRAYLRMRGRLPIPERASTSRRR